MWHLPKLGGPNIELSMRESRPPTRGTPHVRKPLFDLSPRIPGPEAGVPRTHNLLNTVMQLVFFVPSTCICRCYRTLRVANEQGLAIRSFAAKTMILGRPLSINSTDEEICCKRPPTLRATRACTLMCLEPRSFGSRFLIARIHSGLHQSNLLIW